MGLRASPDYSKACVKGFSQSPYQKNCIFVTGFSINRNGIKFFKAGTVAADPYRTFCSSVRFMPVQASTGCHAISWKMQYHGSTHRQAWSIKALSSFNRTFTGCSIGITIRAGITDVYDQGTVQRLGRTMALKIAQFVRRTATADLAGSFTNAVRYRAVCESGNPY